MSTAFFWLTLPVVWLGGTAQPVSARNNAMVPNRLGKRKFIDVSPSGSGRDSTTLYSTLTCDPDGKCVHAPLEREQAAACMGAAFVSAATVLISFHVWRNLSPAA
ncbi:hypothetical protein [Burkholderia pseudomultivorans]|uniref:hypothetical protein n=1 Tax=Burkholderia pseudomultivorans TaxID=1207504 RepID=UPI001E479A04|nr:hypothetical protein [Burkholderia pseudomultivorans]